MQVNRGWRLSGLRVTVPDAPERNMLQLEQLGLAAGEITLIVGRNGAGKTTLLETMAALRKPAAGDVRLDGLPLWKGKRANRDVLLRFGLSQQHSESQWFAKDVQEELRYSLRPFLLPDRKQQQVRIEHALAQSGLGPELLARDPWSLSGGQQRRLALACVIAGQPDWLLLDEPTAGLDAAGISQLCAVLHAHKARGGGAVIVTHDAAALLPITDAVAVIEQGSLGGLYVAEQWRAMLEQGHAPAWLRQAAQPPQAAAASALRAAGFAVPRGEALAPTELAGAIAAQLAPPGRAAPGRGLAACEPGTLPPTQAAALPSAPGGPNTPSPAAPPAAQRQLDTPARGSRWQQRDPRALWIAYLLLAAGILAQRHWLGTLLCAAAALAIVWPLRGYLQPWITAIKLYGAGILFFTVFSGIQFSPLGFRADIANDTAMYLSKLMVIMLLGLLLPSLISPRRLQRTLEQVLQPFSRFKLPVHYISLTVALIFRFIPLLVAEWARFSRIVHARGKSIGKPGRVPIRDLHRVVLPFLLSLLRLADQMSAALEVRGFGRVGKAPSRAYRLRLNREDVYFVFFAAIVMIIFMLFNGF